MASDGDVRLEQTRKYYLEWLNGLHQGKRVNLSLKQIYIGRDRPQCQVTVDDDHISRRHAVIRWAAEGFEMEDLSSRNGALVNGDLISEPTLLRPGDEIQLGRSTTVRFALRSELVSQVADRVGQRATALLEEEKPLLFRQVVEAAVKPSVPEDTVYGPPVKFRCLQHVIKRYVAHTIELRSVTKISVGRAADNNVQIDDPTISRYHDEIATHKDGTVLLVHLDSNRGTAQEIHMDAASGGSRAHGVAPQVVTKQRPRRCGCLLRYSE